MSLLGPRPDVAVYANQLTGAEKSILNVRPGLTDLATLWNPDEDAILEGHPEPDRIYAEKIRPAKVRLQLEYVRSASFVVDLGILLRTVIVILIPASRRRQIEKVRMAVYG
jgi:lipopolysaccharide/colanic/teichoic acid biosynthesis glycosyltransferase